jgi:peptide/nickel transport system permease protein
MLVFAFKRLGLALLVAIVVSLLTFLLLRASGDIATALAGEGSSAADIENIRRLYKLDRPILIQYADWLWRMMQGDAGQSLYFRIPVSDLVMSKLPTTVILGLSSLAFALVISLPLGVGAALRPNSWIDRLCLALAVFGQALPNFFFGLILIMVFSVSLKILPVSGTGSWQHFVLPTVALGYYISPVFMRLVRAGMIDALSSDYIRTARAKGLSQISVVFKHALRNALGPVVALAAVQLGFLLGGSVVIETVFALDGLGYLAYRSIAAKDISVIQTIVVMLSILYVFLIFIADLVNAWIDPRLRTANSHDR